MTNKMNLEKAKEILELNIKEAGSKMPPDVLDALKIGVLGLNFIQKTCPTPFNHVIERHEIIWESYNKHR